MQTLDVHLVGLSLSTLRFGQDHAVLHFDLGSWHHRDCFGDADLAPACRPGVEELPDHRDRWWPFSCYWLLLGSILAVYAWIHRTIV